MSKEEIKDLDKLIEELEYNEVHENEEEAEQFSSYQEVFDKLTVQNEIARMESEVGFDEDCKNQLINSKAFNEGVKYATKYCGIFTTFINFGLSQEQAYETMLNIMNVDHNQEMAKMDIEKAKIQNVMIQGQQI